MPNNRSARRSRFIFRGVIWREKKLGRPLTEDERMAVKEEEWAKFEQRHPRPDYESMGPKPDGAPEIRDAPATPL